MPIPIAYHSGCCPIRTKEMALLILKAYQMYYGSRKKESPAKAVSLEIGDYQFKSVFKAKVLPLSRNKVLGFIATQGDTAYVIFRGTESASEWVGDSRFIQVPFLNNWGKVHKGFRLIYKSCSAEIKEALSELDPTIQHLYIAGHSLGAAISTLACADIRENMRFKTPIHYTFASPRVGDLVFSKRFQQEVPNSYRIMNTEDLVITEPKAALVGSICQFSHVGIPFAFTHHGGSLLNNHLLESYMLYI